jgi:hypothetical protein
MTSQESCSPDTVIEDEWHDAVTANMADDNFFHVNMTSTQVTNSVPFDLHDLDESQIEQNHDSEMSDEMIVHVTPNVETIMQTIGSTDISDETLLDITMVGTIDDVACLAEKICTKHGVVLDSNLEEPQLVKILLDVSIPVSETSTPGVCVIKCNRPNDDKMMMCNTCKGWVHYGCTKLPRYQLFSVIKKNPHRKYECEVCVSTPPTWVCNLFTDMPTLLKPLPTLSICTQTDTQLSEETPIQATSTSTQTEMEQAKPTSTSPSTQTEVEQAKPTSTSAQMKEDSNVDLQRVISTDIRNAIRSLEQNLFTRLFEAKSDAANTKSELLQLKLNASLKEKNATDRALAEAKKVILSLNTKTMEDEKIHEDRARLVKEVQEISQNLHSLKGEKSNLLAAASINSTLIDCEKSHAALEKKCNILQQHLDLSCAKIKDFEVRLESELKNHRATRDSLVTADSILIITQATLSEQQKINSLLQDELLAWKVAPKPDSDWKLASNIKTPRHEFKINTEDMPAYSVNQIQPDETHQQTQPLVAASEIKQISVINRSSPSNSDLRHISSNSETGQNSEYDKTLDLLIIGNSHVKAISAPRLFKNRTVKVISLPEKSIHGAIDFLKTCKLNPKVCILQVASNSIANNTVQSCLAATTELLNLCAIVMPHTKLFLADPLPRSLYSPLQREAYTNKAKAYMSGLDTLRSNSNFTRLLHLSLYTHTPVHYVADGTHLTQRGTAELIKNYKVAVCPALGIFSYKLGPPVNYITPDPRPSITSMTRAQPNRNYTSVGSSSENSMSPADVSRFIGDLKTLVGSLNNW